MSAGLRIVDADVPTTVPQSHFRHCRLAVFAALRADQARQPISLTPRSLIGANLKARMAFGQPAFVAPEIG
jgi:hypothetical protein